MIKDLDIHIWGTSMAVIAFFVYKFLDVHIIHRSLTYIEIVGLTIVFALGYTILFTIIWGIVEYKITKEEST